MATLLGTNLSPYVRKVLIFSFEAGIELEHRYLQQLKTRPGIQRVVTMAGAEL